MANREKDFVNYPTFDEKTDRTKFAVDEVMEQNPSAVQATSFAGKKRVIAQIIRLEEAELIRSLEQAESFAENCDCCRPKKSRATCENRLI